VARQEAFEQDCTFNLLVNVDDAVSVERARDAPGPPFVARPLHDLEHDGGAIALAESNE
jgi:hypothetical protein